TSQGAEVAPGRLGWVARGGSCAGDSGNAPRLRSRFAPSLRSRCWTQASISARRVTINNTFWWNAGLGRAMAPRAEGCSRAVSGCGRTPRLEPGRVAGRAILAQLVALHPAGKASDGRAGVATPFLAADE